MSKPPRAEDDGPILLTDQVRQRANARLRGETQAEQELSAALVWGILWAIGLTGFLLWLALSSD